MDQKKLPVDFKVKNAKKGFNPFSAASIALSVSLMLYFVTKFVWSPFQRSRNYKEAEEVSDLLFRHEQEVKNPR